MLHDEFKQISHKALTVGRSPKEEFITIPKSLFEDSSLSHRELMNRVEELAKQ
ncbi:hypothetical protein [Streptococcus gallolyticus]|uniref:hypothetical protein n=1 Tax=Streptococcus gallolyticus TaxID=315405 RepID=UPI003D6F982D